MKVYNKNAVFINTDKSVPILCNTSYVMNCMGIEFKDWGQSFLDDYLSTKLYSSIDEFSYVEFVDLLQEHLEDKFYIALNKSINYDRTYGHILSFVMYSFQVDWNDIADYITEYLNVEQQIINEFNLKENNESAE